MMTKYIELPKASFLKRVYANILDIILLVFVFLLVFTGVNRIIDTNKDFRRINATIIDLKLESGLYSETNDTVLFLSDVISDLPIVEQNLKYQQVYDSFFQNQTFFSGLDGPKVFQDYALQYLPLLFKVDETAPLGVSPLSSATSAQLNVFYEKTLNEFALAFLFNSPDYFGLNRVVLYVNILSIVVSVFVSTLLLFFIVPLAFFRRGFRTIGMKVANIAFVNVNGFSISIWKGLLRYTLVFFINFVLNVAFLIPMIISNTMMKVRKDGASLIDYIANIYAVDISSNTVYKNYQDYYEKVILKTTKP